MESMITSIAHGYTQQFCVACVDTRADLRGHLLKNLDHIKVTELVFDEVCDACGHPIRSVPVYQRLFRLKPELRIALTAEMPACSALEARMLLHEGIEGEALLKLLQQRIDSDLSEGELLYDPGTLTYHVSEPQVLPPPRDEWVTDIPNTHVPVASPPATLSELFDLASVQDLLNRFERAGLQERYPGSFETCLLLHHLFAQANMEHGLMQGYLSHKQEATHPHVWLDLSPVLGPGWVVDYRARSRFGQEAPIGLFTRKESLTVLKKL